MHLWQNPHHADKETYKAWENQIGFLRRWWERFCHVSARLMEPQPTNEPPARNMYMDPDKPIPPRRKSFVFLRTPKRVGEPIENSFGDDDPEGWGMLFDEGFQVHRLLIALLAFNFLGSLGFILSAIFKELPLSPSTLPALISFWSWLVGSLALFLTVWFKWAETL